ncbi:MAG: hypothetical protein ACRDLZ_03250 [Gaiellaceae bacterium]
MAEDTFDPIAILQALDRHGVTYIVIGALGRVIHGSDEVTDGVDVVPSTREENLRRLGLALEALNARRSDGKPPVLDRDLSRRPVLELETDAGELQIVPEPAGTRGYDDLRRDASREPLGRGLRPRVASLGDHSRMLAALGRDQDRELLPTIRRLIELEHELTRRRVIER